MIENPVLIKEVKTKMRSRQPVRVQAAIAVLVGLFILYCYYQAIGWLVQFGGANAANDGWRIALGMQAILIWLLAPAVTANAISQEKEQQTWEMLLFTLLTPWEILSGKLAARIAPILAIVAAFAPFMLFCYLRGTVTIGQFLVTYLVFFVWIIFLTTVGLFMSWAFRRTAAAIATAYLVVFTLVIGTTLINMTLSLSQNWVESWIWWLNPIRACEALMSMSTDSYAGGVLTLSTVTYCLLAVFLLARMTKQFRAFSID
jgi:ABC-type transport system involved in multi-copper enzyme maturation permease subunit